MYSLLTADDEPDKLEALRNNFDWAQYGVRLCGEAGSGPDAYEQIVAKRPDICIMDIKMPGISGLEVIKRAKDEGVDTKCIVLSGYDEFDYAKEALSLSAVEYLLKPCRPEEILQAVLKSIALIEEERRQKRLLNNYRNLLEVQERSQKLKFLRALLSGDSAGPTEKRLAAYQLEWLAGPVAVFVFATPDEEADASRSAFPNLAELVRKEFVSLCRAEVLIYNLQIVVIAGLEQLPENFDAIYRATDGLIGRIGREYGVTCMAGVSDLKQGAAQLHGAYLEAKEAVNTSLFLFDRSIAFFAELDHAITLKYPDQMESGVFSSINGDLKQLPKAVDLFLSSCKSRSPNAKKHVQEAAITLICNAYNAALEHGACDGSLSEEKSEAASRILECGTVSGMEKVLLDFLSRLPQRLPVPGNLSAPARKALAYIDRNYSGKVTLETVAEEIHVTPSYLSMIFKQQTGLNLIEYLNRYRIEKSKELVCAGNLKIYEIAYRVGYQDEKYFHMMFKRYTGMTAKQFRNGASGGGDFPASAVLAK